MTSARPGQSTSAVEVTNVSPHGFWLLVGRREYFVRFTDFPWFRDATIAELMRVELPSPHHLYWPDLDVDLAVESLDHPERRLKEHGVAARYTFSFARRSGSSTPLS